MDLLKLALKTSLALIFLNYNEKVGNIILAIDVSLEEWKKMLMQLVKRKQYLLGYKSEIQSVIKKKYNATKRKY